jgi:Na+-transporting methylmalonyl-CoA/oxaloacetate decarboxylase gamma subunit
MLLAQQNARPLIDFTLSPLFEDYGIPLAVMGVLVVFVALVLIGLFIILLPKVFGGPPAAASEATVASLFAPDELPEETLVVIAAAVAETMRQPQRIVRIRGLTSEDLDWTLGGRMQHHRSHKIQRDRR